MQSYFSGKYWWLGVAAIVALTLIFYHGLIDRKQPLKPAPIVQQRPVQPVVKVQRPIPSHPVLDLFNPSTQSITRDQSISRTRSELEQLFVIRILLERCNIITESEATAVQTAGLEYAARSRLFADSAAVIAELETQAQQTHDLVYAQTSCGEKTLQALKDQTLAWQAQFSQ